MDNEEITTAILARSLSWDSQSIMRMPARRPRRRFAKEACAWQTASQRGSWAAMRSVVDQSAGRRARSQDPNRIVEIHGLVGAIGEQAGLCWTIEQDAQRLDANRSKMSVEYHRLVLRALSESAGHFLLGAAHSLGNLGLRLALLDGLAASKIYQGKRRVDFSPGTDDRQAWLSLAPSSLLLNKAAAASPTASLSRIASTISSLANDSRYDAFSKRRGMDFHRMRPQSVPHASPKSEMLPSSNGVIRSFMPEVFLDPEAESVQVHQSLVAAMESVRGTMGAIRRDLGKVMRAAGIWYHEEIVQPRGLSVAISDLDKSRSSNPTTLDGCDVSR